MGTKKITRTQNSNKYKRRLNHYKKNIKGYDNNSLTMRIKKRRKRKQKRKRIMIFLARKKKKKKILLLKMQAHLLHLLQDHHLHPQEIQKVPPLRLLAQICSPLFVKDLLLRKPLNLMNQRKRK